MKLFWSATYFYDIIQLVEIVSDHYVMKKLDEICEWWEAEWRGSAARALAWDKLVVRCPALICNFGNGLCDSARNV